MARKSTYEEAADFGSEVNKVVLISIFVSFMLGTIFAGFIRPLLEDKVVECCEKEECLVIKTQVPLAPQVDLNEED